MNSEAAGLIIASGQNASRAAPSDGYGFGAKGWIVANFDRGIKAIHIDMNDFPFHVPSLKMLSDFADVYLRWTSEWARHL